MRLKHYLAVAPHAGFAGYAPADLARAYGMAHAAGAAPVKIGIGSLGGAHSAADLASAFSAWNLPAPTVAVLSVAGAAQKSDPGADVENALDVQWAAGVFSACTAAAADVSLCFAPNSGSGIALATKALADAGCEVISWSWGAPEADWAAADRALTESAFAYAQQKGCTVLAASGDASLYDGTRAPAADYPAGSARVWGVGGTTLVLAADGAIAGESAWGDGGPAGPGSGGGYDGNTPRPAWQAGVAGAFRGVPDSASAADPARGAAVRSGGRWQLIGGTSWAAPTTAGYLAVCRAIARSRGLAVPGALGPTLYARPDAFRDVKAGSNGAAAGAGWDRATGLGSIDGAKMLEAILGASGPAPPPVLDPVPPCPAPLFTVTVGRDVPAGGTVGGFRTKVAIPAGRYGWVPQTGAHAHAAVTQE